MSKSKQTKSFSNKKEYLSKLFHQQSKQQPLLERNLIPMISSYMEYPSFFYDLFNKRYSETFLEDPTMIIYENFYLFSLQYRLNLKQHYRDENELIYRGASIMQGMPIELQIIMDEIENLHQHRTIFGANFRPDYWNLSYPLEYRFTAPSQIFNNEWLNALIEAHNTLINWLLEHEQDFSIEHAKRVFEQSFVGFEGYEVAYMLFEIEMCLDFYIEQIEKCRQMLNDGLIYPIGPTSLQWLPGRYRR